MLAKEMLTDPKVKFAVKMIYGKNLPNAIDTMLNMAKNRGVSEEEIQGVFNYFGMNLNSAREGKGFANTTKK